jgi:hypothetical protein
MRELADEIANLHSNFKILIFAVNNFASLAAIRLTLERV